MDKDKIRKEIYWIFRDAIHNGHRQITFKDGKVTAFKPEKEPDSIGCYVCQVLHKVEKKIAKLYGDKDYYTDTLEKKNEKTKKDI